MKYHMSSTTTTSSRNPSVFGYVCHITANEQSGPDVAHRNDDQVARERRLRVRCIIASLLRRRSKNKSSETSVEDRCPLAESARERPNVTPPPTSLHHSTLDHHTQDHFTPPLPTTAPFLGTHSKQLSTASSTSEASLNNEAWKLSLVSPFMDHTLL